ncbi:hypothetical protein [Achromobacter aloeverae]
MELTNAAALNLVISGDYIHHVSSKKEMNKSDWYENRIRWRARKHRLDAFFWEAFLLSNSAQAEEIAGVLKDYGTPTLVFWKNSDEWTVRYQRCLGGQS